MDLARAIELLSALAQGINPFTGEVLAENCVCNQAEMIRALYCVLNEVNPLLEKKKSQPQNAWKPWTQEEEEQLLQEYRADNDALCHSQSAWEKQRSNRIQVDGPRRNRETLF